MPPDLQKHILFRKLTRGSAADPKTRHLLSDRARAIQMYRLVDENASPVITSGSGTRSANDRPCNPTSNGSGARPIGFFTARPPRIEKPASTWPSVSPCRTLMPMNFGIEVVDEHARAISGRCRQGGAFGSAYTGTEGIGSDGLRASTCARPRHCTCDVRPILHCVYLMPSLTCEERERGCLGPGRVSGSDPGDSGREVPVLSHLRDLLATLLGGIHNPDVLLNPYFWLSLIFLAMGSLGIGMTHHQDLVAF